MNSLLLHPNKIYPINKIHKILKGLLHATFKIFTRLRKTSIGCKINIQTYKNLKFGGSLLMPITDA